MSHSGNMSLKAFWKAVEERLAACSMDELCAILRAMAQETPPAARPSFLAKLERTGERGDAVRQVLQQEELLDDVDDLAQDLQAMMTGQVPQDRYEWYEYDDEDALGPYKEFVDPLIDLFDRAAGTFDYGPMSLAREAYQRLFALLGLEDNYGRGMRLSDLTGIDQSETVARYLRAVYETEPPEDRPRVLYEQMWQMRSLSYALSQRVPTLEDLIQIAPHPLPERDRFLADWIAFLRTQNGSQVDAWLREAIRLSEGTPGLERLARTEGETHPHAYLDWFTALEQEGRHDEVYTAAQEALRVLPAQLDVRAAIADHLCAAAARLGDQETVRAGRWQAFLAQSTLTRLLDLWDAFPARVERTSAMQRAMQYAQEGVPPPFAYGGELNGRTEHPDRAAWVHKPVLVHACLLAQELEAAHRLAAGKEVLGWSNSSNPQGIVVAFFLVLLSGQTPETVPPNLAQIWQWGLDYSTGFFSSERQDIVCRRLERAYGEVFATTSLDRDRQRRLLSWCLEVAQRRVEAIVSNQHRGSYDKAAVLAAACAETLRLRGDREAADTFVEETRNRFPRHRAFQAELRSALARSVH